MIKIHQSDVLKRLGLQTMGKTHLGRILESLPAISEEGPWVAGGAVRRVFEGDYTDTDFDFFFRNVEQKDAFVKQILSSNSAKIVSNDKNATLTVPGFNQSVGEDEFVYVPERTVQAIHFRYYESPQDVIDSFDYTMTQFAYDGAHFYMGNFSLYDVARKRLVPHKITYATDSLRRMLKYANQGYTVCAGAMSEVLQQVADNPKIIEASTLYID